MVVSTVNQWIGHFTSVLTSRMDRHVILLLGTIATESIPSLALLFVVKVACTLKLRHCSMTLARAKCSIKVDETYENVFSIVSDY